MPRADGLAAIELQVVPDAGEVVAGDEIVAAGRRALFGWTALGGPGRRLAPLPDLGPFSEDGIFSSGYLRVDAAVPGRVAVVRRNTGSAGRDFELGQGQQLVSGPPRGPFAPVAGCGEIGGPPAALDGDVIAYRSQPVRGDCAARPVRSASIVVRDLAAGGAVRAVLPLAPADRGIGRLQVAGPFVAYAPNVVGEAPGPVTVVDTRTGAPATRLPDAEYEWTLAPDGTLFAFRPSLRSGQACRPLRRYPVGDRTGVPVPGARPCFLGLLDVADGAVRFNQRLPGGRFAFRAVDPITGAGRTLAATSGMVIDASATLAVADDRTCLSGYDARIIDLTAGAVPAAGPRRCPLSARTPRAARAGGRVRVVLRCRCRVAVTDRTKREEILPGERVRSTGRTVTVRGRRVLRLRVSPRAARLGRMRIALTPQGPVVAERRVRTVRIR